MDKSPITILRKEHTSCAKELIELEKSLNQFEKTLDIQKLKKDFEKFYFFIQTKHKIHIKNEEEALFPFVTKNPDLADIEISRLISEHKTENILVQDITKTFLKIKDEEETPYSFTEEVIRMIKNLISSLRKHLWDEESNLFIKIEEKLTPSELEQSYKKMLKIKNYNSDTVENMKF